MLSFLFFRIVIESNFVVRVPGLKKQISRWHSDPQSHLVITPYKVWRGRSEKAHFEHSKPCGAVPCAGG